MKNKVIKLLIKHGNNESDVIKMVEAEFYNAVKSHPEAKASKLAEIIRCVY